MRRGMGSEAVLGELLGSYGEDGQLECVGVADLQDLARAEKGRFRLALDRGLEQDGPLEPGFRGDVPRARA